MTDERGVSDVVAFVLSFSIIVTTVTFVSVLGFGDIADRSAQIRTESADDAMQGLAAAFNEIGSQGAPSRSSELRLGGGSLRFDDSATMRVTIHQRNNNLASEFEVGSLNYRSDDGRISYENGALFRQEQPSQRSLMRVEPLFSCSDSVAIVSIVNLSVATDSLSYAGDDSVVITGVRTSQSLLVNDKYNRNDVTSVTIDVAGSNTEHSEAWSQFLDESEWEERGPRSYRCSATRVVVRETRIDVSVTG